MTQTTSTHDSLIPEEIDSLLKSVPAYEIEVEDEYDTNVGDLIDPYENHSSTDVGIVGIPSDTGCVAGPRGSRYGPAGVRDKITHGTAYNPEIDISIESGVDILDFGDVRVQATDLQETHRRVEKVLTAINAQDVFTIGIGGDHSHTYPTGKALMNATDGNVGVINVDAHHDVRHSHGGELSAGTPFRRLLEDESGQLAGENFVELGLSGWHNSEYYVDYVRDNGGTILPAREIHREGAASTAQKALEIATEGTDAVFVSVDIDVLDVASAPGTCAPSPGGLKAYQLLEIVYQLVRDEQVKAADLMEVAPPLDTGDVTTMTAAAVVTQMFGAQKESLN